MPTGKFRTDFQAPRGADAARVRQRKHALQRRFRLPETVETMLPGALTLTHVRCGKPTCHCATGPGHPAWHLTVRIEEHTRVIHIPAAWVTDIQARVDAGRAFQDAVRDVLAANAQLLVLARRQRRR